jgi:hypothetical protein
MNIEKSQQQLSQLYNELSRADDTCFLQNQNLLESDTFSSKVDQLFHQIQDLDEQEKSNLLHLLKIDDTPQETSF